MAGYVPCGGGTVSTGADIGLSVAAWVLLSIPLGVIVGHLLRRLG